MRDQLVKDAVEIAWRHWTALGVRGVAPIPDDAIDLEALIAFTPMIATAEPRLAMEARDWCVRIGPRFLSVSRLKHLVKLFPEAKGPGLASDAIGAALRSGDLPKTSGKSRDPDLERPSLIALRARTIFGVGARADLIVTLLRHRDRSSGVFPSDLVSLGYTKRTIANVLDDLTTAGVTATLPVRNTATFWLGRSKPIAELLAPVPPRIPQWVERFAIVAAILDVAAHHASKSPVSYAVELNNAFDRIEPLARSLGVVPPSAGGAENVVVAAERWALELLAG